METFKNGKKSRRGHLDPDGQPGQFRQDNRCQASPSQQGGV